MTVTASGQKLKPIIIFKRKTMPKVRFPPGVVVLVNEKGWFNNDTMKDWRKIWDERQGREADPNKSLVILDSAPSHLHENSRNELKKSSKVAVIPGGCTRFVQPLDISVNKSFKDHLQTHWKAWYAEETQAEYTKSGRRKRPHLEVVSEWVRKSFEDVSIDCIKNGFRKALTPDDEYRMESMLEAFTDLAVDDKEEHAEDDELDELNTTLDSLELGS